MGYYIGLAFVLLGAIMVWIGFEGTADQAVATIFGSTPPTTGKGGSPNLTKPSSGTTTPPNTTAGGSIATIYNYPAGGSLAVNA